MRLFLFALAVVVSAPADADTLDEWRTLFGVNDGRVIERDGRLVGVMEIDGDWFAYAEKAGDAPVYWGYRLPDCDRQEVIRVAAADLVADRSAILSDIEILEALDEIARTNQARAMGAIELEALCGF